MFKSKKLLALVILSSIAQGLPLLGPNAFATNILGQPDFMNPIPPPAQPTFETSWGNNPSGIAQQPSANSGSSHTGHDSNGVGQPYQAPLMSQPTFGGQSNSNNAALPNNVPTPYEAPKFLTLPAAPNLFAPQNPVPQAVDMQGMAFELLWAAQTFDNFYGITQVNKINSLASCQNSLLDQNQLNARYDQLRNSSDVDNLINDLEALATELNSRSRQLDSINHETLKTFNDNQKSPHQQIRGLNQAGFDKYYKSFSEVSKYFVETWGWTKTSINQLKDRKKHIGLSEREQRIQDAVDRATADARNRLEQARQATSNRRAEIRELQRIRANVNSSQIQQVHVERIASEVNEALPRMTAHMEQSAGDYIRNQLQSSQELAQTGIDLATNGASDSVVRIVSSFAVDTAVSIQSFTSGFAGGVFQGFLTSAQVASAIFSNPTLITNLSVGIMNTISGGPGAVGNAVQNGFQHIAGAVYQFEVTMAFGTAAERGHALGEFGANVLLGIAGGEAAAGVRATFEGITTNVARGSAAEAVGTAINSGIRASETLAPKVTTIESGVRGLSEAARSHGLDIVFGTNASRVDKVLAETLARTGNITSEIILSSDEALQAGLKWVGPSYRE